MNWRYNLPKRAPSKGIDDMNNDAREALADKRLMGDLDDFLDRYAAVCVSHGGSRKEIDALRKRSIAYFTALRQPAAPGGEANETIKRQHKQLLELWSAIAGGPGPHCRDCADFNGRCQGDGLPCDPQSRALERVAKLRTSPPPSDERAKVIEAIELLAEYSASRGLSRVTAWVTREQAEQIKAGTPVQRTPSSTRAVPTESELRQARENLLSSEGISLPWDSEMDRW